MTSSVKFITTFIFSTLFVLILSPRCDAQQEKLTKNGSIRDKNHETFTSPAKVFQMGFFGFEPNLRYLGIWYYADPKTIVWVANRNNPLSSSSSFLTIENDANLVVRDNSRKYFTTGLPSASGSISWTLKLEDTGNLILQDGSGKQMWSSFSFPTDTFFPGMYMEKEMKLTSWKTQNDPGYGDYVFQKDTVFGYDNYTIFAGKRLHWKSGLGLESNMNPTKVPIDAIHLLSKSNSSKILNSSRLVMSSSGEIQFFYWDLTFGKWVLNWSERKDYCSKYNACGQNSYCSIRKTNNYNWSCNCLPGFDLIPDAVTNEKACKRTAPICIGNDTNFLSMEIVKIDVTFEKSMESTSELECKEKCLGLDCCQAYSYSAVGNEELARTGVPGGKQGCWIWSSDSPLLDLQDGDKVGGRILSIRNPISKGIRPSQIANGKAKRSKPLSHQVVIFSAIVIPGFMLLLCCIFFICCRRTNIKKVPGTADSESVHQFNKSVRQIQDLLDPLNSNEKDSSDIGIPFFDFERISASTDEFSEENKIGEGGFGPVYKDVQGWNAKEPHC